MIETAMAILNVRDIAATSQDPDARLSCMMLGTNDIAKETGASMANTRVAMLPWLSQCVVAAKAYGLSIIDGVANDFRDLSSLKAECTQGRDIGMDGKSLIHPNQIDTANRIFSPSEEALAWAKQVIAEFDKPENATLNVLSIDGAMVERLHADMARKTLNFADQISHKG
jgi:citrate lyase subunit beta/citryl-CoA lyase